MKYLVILIGFSGVIACDGQSPAPAGPAPLGLADGCQPLLGGQDCLLPYPSDFFVTADSAGDHAVNVADVALSQTDDGRLVRLSTTRPQAGFSRVPSITAILPEAVSNEGLPALLGPSGYSVDQGQSPTLLLDVESQSLVPHFVDIDPRPEDPTRRALVMHALEILQPGRRYIVAFRNVKNSEGQDIAAPEGFARLRDRLGDSDPVLKTMVPHYESDIFAPLEAMGVERTTLQLAWDFTTGPDEDVTADMFRMRQLTIDALAAKPATVEVTSVEEPPEGNTWRIVHGIIKGPNFLSSPKDPLSPLARDSEGLVIQNGEVSFGFAAVIPHSAKESISSVPIVAYGHGFFQSRYELLNHGNPGLAHDIGVVMVAIDWVGMSNPDLPKILTNMIAEPNETLTFINGVHQAMMNWMAVTDAFDGPMALDPAFKLADDHPTRPSSVVYDTQKIHYLGVSMGHILGGVQAALNPQIERYAFNVGGAGLTLMMPRARPFTPLIFSLELLVSDRLEQQKIIAQSQRHFDRMDPAVYADYVLKKTLADSPQRQVLIQMGLADVLVPNVASVVHARGLGIGGIGPLNDTPWPIDAAEEPAKSGFSSFDFGWDLAVYEPALAAEEDNMVHHILRFADSAKIQLEEFFAVEGGTVIHPCDGVCDPN